MVRGFLNPTVRERVILEDPKSIDEVAEKAVSIARALHMAHHSLTPIGSYPKTTHEPMDVDVKNVAKMSFKSASDQERQKSRSRSRSVDGITKKMGNLNLEGKSAQFKPRESRNDTFNRKYARRSNSYISEVDERKNAVKCHFCQKLGHMIRDCREKLKNEGRCFLCKKIGHNQNECWSANRSFSRNEMAQNTASVNKNMGRLRFQPSSTNGRNNRGRSAERFDREGLNRKRSTSAEKQQLLNDIGDFFATAKKDLGHGHEQ